MVDAVFNSPRRTRLASAALVAGIHLVLVVALVRAFAPQIGEAVPQPVTTAFDVVVPKSPPPPSKDVIHRVQPREEGATAPAGKKATHRPVSAPTPRVVIQAPSAPPIAATGTALTAGASESGQGTGAGGVGHGLGAGGQGAGTGAGTGAGASKVAKVSGDIVSAGDYPRATRALRLGDSVTVSLTVGIDGKAKDCRIVRASRDPEADRITCRLAIERFRFSPARDAAGRPVEAVYGWQQRWFAPGTQ